MLEAEPAIKPYRRVVDVDVQPGLGDAVGAHAPQGLGDERPADPPPPGRGHDADLHNPVDRSGHEPGVAQIRQRGKHRPLRPELVVLGDLGDPLRGGPARKAGPLPESGLVDPMEAPGISVRPGSKLGAGRPNRIRYAGSKVDPQHVLGEDLPQTSSSEQRLSLGGQRLSLDGDRLMPSLSLVQAPGEQVGADTTSANAGIDKPAKGHATGGPGGTGGTGGNEPAVMVTALNGRDAGSAPSTPEESGIGSERQATIDGEAARRQRDKLPLVVERKLGPGKGVDL